MPIKLNLGCGLHPIVGYVNVDRSGSPDIKHDLEHFPWPWADSSVDQIVMTHVLEHLGETVEIFFKIIKELYRVCQHNAIIDITVPHPRHDDFLGDPTHMRPFTPEIFQHYSKANCLAWQKSGAANTPFALYLDVDFITKSVEFDLDDYWLNMARAGKINEADLMQAIRQFMNVVKQIRVRWIVNKP